jgi:hypothetical protein
MDITMDTVTAPTATTTNAPPPQMGLPSGMAGRIPASLQAIFLASNQGAVVHDAPSNGVASKQFVRSGTTNDVVLEKNRQPISISSLSGSNNNNNNMSKNSTFAVTKKRIPTKLALFKSVERNKMIVRYC